MSSLNINTLFEEMDQKVINRLKMFDDILVQIHNKIKLNSKNKTLYCTFQIPEFLIGKPLYKIKDLRKKNMALEDKNKMPDTKANEEDIKQKMQLALSKNIIK